MKFTYILFVFLFACTSATEDDIVGQSPEVDDEPELVLFAEIEPIFINRCQMCHSNPPQNGAPMPLVLPEDVSDAIQNRGLINRISLANGNPNLMPQGGPRLPQSDIDLIIKWQNDGFLSE
ncbi:cytochrome c [Flavobacteriaceae bacterium 14752]|uniref:cytochrome c n=1 Tax=Mesohalobacter salilacus TaxID=2491711 RepID=UPI000F639CA4|nr:cytochrome c [Flavobacteriaceae bacterium 14752]